jgi:RNA polymerase II subunit A small phosphatase-like protein
MHKRASMHLVILDLDETLVHSCDEWIGRSHNFLAADKMIFVRPYAEEFVRQLLLKYKVAVWTASYGKYTSDIVEYFFGGEENLEFVWDRNSCNLECVDKENFKKSIQKVYEAGWNESSFSIVDDRPEHVEGAGDSVIGLKPYFGSASDQELVEVLNKIRVRANV